MRRRGPGRPAGAPARQGREALLVAARELMAEKGLPRVTLREVAQRAGVQPALVHYYFGSKEGLLRAVTALVAGELVGRIQQAASLEGSSEDRVRSLVEAVTASFAADPYAPRLLIEQVLFGEPDVIDGFVDRFARPNLAAIRGLLESGRASGELREVEPMFLLPALIGCCHFFFLAAPILQRVFGIDEITPDLARRFADHTAALVLDGIAAPAGRPA